MVDEVQEIEGWENAINSLLAQGLVDILNTGSNAHLLSTELATLLTGRYIEIPVYPLSFSEFMAFRQAVCNPQLDAMPLREALSSLARGPEMPETVCSDSSRRESQARSEP